MLWEQSNRAVTRRGHGRATALGSPQGLGASLIREVTLESTGKEPEKEGQPIEPV